MIFEYAGIGSRKTPRDVCRRMTQLAEELNKLGFTLRSGAADAADAAFEAGSGDEKKIFLPWKNFNRHTSPLFDVTPEAIEIAEPIYNLSTPLRLKPPKLSNLSRAVQRLMGRNSYQVLDLSLNRPADFTLCWTPDGAERITDRKYTTGGTGQAIALSSHMNVCVFNMQKADWEERFYEYLEGLLDMKELGSGSGV